MQAKIFIKRQFRDGSQEAINALLKKIRIDALKQPGYVSGETLIDRDNHHKVLVISTWKTMEDWERWIHTPSRQEDETMLESYMMDTPRYEFYLEGEFESV